MQKNNAKWPVLSKIAIMIPIVYVVLFEPKNHTANANVLHVVCRHQNILCTGRIFSGRTSDKIRGGFLVSTTLPNDRVFYDTV